MRKPRTIKEMVERQKQILDYKYIITEDTPFGENLPNQEQPFGQNTEQPPMEQSEPQIQGQEISFNGQTDNTKEIDVTDLVKGQEEVSQKVDSFKQQIFNLNKVLSTLQDKISKMDILLNKVNSLETEIKEMNPSPEEKIEMVSLNTYPYNITLKDFWANKTDKIKPVDTVSNDFPKEMEKEEEVFKLTPEEIDDYNEKEIEKSFIPESLKKNNK